MSGGTHTESPEGGQDGSMPYRSVSGPATPQFGGAPDHPRTHEWPSGHNGDGQPDSDPFHVQKKAKVKASDVYEQMSENFPPEAIEWIKHVEWEGPVDVPHDKFDTDDYDKWATSHQPEKVAKFQRKIRDGEHINPVVAVQVPKDPKLKIVDGHHRFTAHRGLGKDTPTYIGVVPEKVGPWTQTHSYQIHQGDHPANKGDAVKLKAAGLLVRAEDTGRVLLIQRALGDDDDSAGGKWELPGGCLDEGEMPFDAAVREWKEETGLEVPEGKTGGTWLSADGVYRGFWWLTDHEQDVEHLGEREPDPDGDHMESLAWFSLDDIRDNPAVRQEVRDGFELMIAGLAFGGSHRE